MMAIFDLGELMAGMKEQDIDSEQGIESDSSDSELNKIDQDTDDSQKENQ